jgi:hypothetical protein
MIPKILLLVIVCIQPIISIGQNKHITIGYLDNGVVFGNSKKSNGIRLNFWDKSVKFINGINATLKSNSQKSNGISIGLIANNDSIGNGIFFGGLVSSGTYINGISISGLINGVTNRVNGIGIAGLVSLADTMNGIFINVIGTTKVFNGEFTKAINGITIGMINDAIKFKGLSVAFQNRTDTLRGICIGLVYNTSKDTKGLQIGMCNNSKSLHGIQIGLWNIAENKRFLRRMPIINFSFRKRAAGNN